MGLEADDGRPETSPPLRGVVQTADRAVVRERQAIPGDQGRVRHRAIDPAALGPRHPDSGSTRGGATGGWRWRWTFQNKRRRYSHEGRRDTGQRRPLPDIGAMRDTGRSPLHLLLDDRASRDGACGSDRRRRARGPARRPRTLRRQEDQGRPGKEGRHRVQETHRRHHARTGHAGAYARGRSEPHGTWADEARLANLPDRGSDGYAPHTRPAGDLTYVRVGGDWAYVCLLVDLADRGIVGHSAGRTRDASLVLGAFATLDFPPADVQVFHTDRGGEFDNTGIDELLRVFGMRVSNCLCMGSSD